ncbi:MAG: DUF748 domain-containing protein [Thermodesulfovibrionia bacterium]|nr:DUF748 domain-containing protein [Thermodesulfovibrionia bacterium]
MATEINQKKNILKAFTLKRIAIGIALSLIIFTVAGFFIAPPLLKWFAVKKLSEQLHREVTIEKIKINPFALTAEIKGFRIKERDGSAAFISFDDLFVNVQGVSVVKRGLIVDEIRLTNPYVHIVHNDGAVYNFSDLLTPPKADNKIADKQPLRFSLNNIQVVSGAVDFIDSPKKTEHAIKNLSLMIPFFSNLPYYVDTYVQPSLTGTLNGTPFVFNGKTKPYKDSLETVFDINVKDLNIPYYLAYVPFDMNFNLQSGSMDAISSLSYIQYSKSEPSLNVEGTVSFKDIQVNDLTGNHIFSMPRADIQIARSDIFSRKIHIAGITVDSPSLTLIRSSDNKINILSLIPEDKSKKEDSSPGTSFVLSTDEVMLSNGSVSFTDLVPNPSFKTDIKKIDLKVSGFSTEPGNKTSIDSLSLNLAKKGSLNTSGIFSTAPMEADVKFELKDADIPSLHPYYADRIAILLTSGNLSVSGTALLEYSPEKGLSASYKGKAMVTDFASVDSINTEDLLKWKSLYFGGIDVKLEPLALSVNEISLTDFYSKIIVNEDGTLNLQKIVVQAPSDVAAKSEVPKDEKLQKTDTAPAANKIPIKVGKITLQGGAINFSDRFIKPNYTANLSEMGGRISGFSSKEDSAGEVDLKGKFENYSPLEIKGKINPLRDDLFLDLTVSFRDMDLSPVTPYSGKYLGYAIQKGKLTLDLRYLIVKKQLDSQNNVFIDQLTLGESVESPDAVKLPVSLAIALLKDRSGAIKLDVPVTGSIDDPEFSVFRIVIKILLNLIVKAATSPFALLGAIFGGGDELSYVEFEYGSHALSEDALKKIDTVIKALYERPSIRMEIEGHVDTENDMEGLRQYIFNKKLKSQKLKDMIKKGETAVQVDDVTILPDEYEKYLRKAYKDEKFPKPRNVIGMAKDLPVPEMEKLMLTHIEVKESDLRLLAGQRALAIKDHLLKSEKVEGERIFLIEPKELLPEKKENVKNSRVDFRLK